MHFYEKIAIKLTYSHLLFQKIFRGICPRTPVSPVENFIKRGEGKGKGMGGEARRGAPQFVWPRALKYFKPVLVPMLISFSISLHNGSPQRKHYNARSKPNFDFIIKKEKRSINRISVG
jgi:hypothetical protein